MNITPDYYTTHNGGKWLPWVGGEIKDLPTTHITKWEQARLRVSKPTEGERKQGEPYVAKEFLIELHSFALGNPIGQPRGSYIRWDSYNGFTTSPKDVATMNEGR